MCWLARLAHASEILLLSKPMADYVFGCVCACAPPYGIACLACRVLGCLGWEGAGCRALLLKLAAWAGSHGWVLGCLVIGCLPASLSPCAMHVSTHCCHALCTMPCMCKHCCHVVCPTVHYAMHVSNPCIHALLTVHYAMHVPNHIIHALHLQHTWLQARQAS